ncbi:MAG: hypothetical protein AAF376_19445 [Pseudomonadota bacterium]
MFSNPWPDFDPEGTLQFTFHDRPDSLSTVTGRFVIYEVEMGHLNRAGGGLPNAPSSSAMMLDQFVEQDTDGSFVFHPLWTVGGERRVGGTSELSDHFHARISAVGHPNLGRLNRLMSEARQSARLFPGYEMKPGGPGRDDTYHLNETYCGFDMYEWTSIPDWLARNEASPTPPF